MCQKYILSIHFLIPLNIHASEWHENIIDISHGENRTVTGHYSRFIISKIGDQIVLTITERRGSSREYKKNGVASDIDLLISNLKGMKEMNETKNSMEEWAEVSYLEDGAIKTKRFDAWENAEFLQQYKRIIAKLP